MNTDDRFIITKNEDGSETIQDEETGYTIKHYVSDGYIAYDTNGKEVYHVYPDGTTSFKTADGYNIISSEKLSIDQIGRDMTITDRYNYSYVIDDAGSVVDRFSTTYTNGIETIQDRETGYTIKHKSDGYIAYDTNGKEVYHVYPDGTTSFKTADGNSIISSEKLSIDQIGRDMTITDQNNNSYIINDAGSVVTNNSDSVAINEVNNNESRFYVNNNNVVNRETNEIITVMENDGTISLFMTNDGGGVLSYEHINIDQFHEGTIINGKDGYLYKINNNGYAEKVTDFDDIKYTDKRFGEASNIDGTKSLIDRKNCIEVYKIDKEGIIYYKTPSGKIVESKQQITIDFIGNDTLTIEDENGHLYTINNDGYAEKVTDYDDEKYADKRFYNVNNKDGTISIIDRKNEYIIKEDYKFGYYDGYDEQGKKVFSINKSDNSGWLMSFPNKIKVTNMTIEKISRDMTVVDEEGNTIVLLDNKIIEKTYPSGSSDKYYYDNDLDYNVIYSNNEKVYYHDGKEVVHFYNDGHVMIHDNYGNELVYYSIENGKKANYQILDDNAILCNDEQGNKYVYNMYGTIMKYTTSDGTEYDYNYDKSSQKVTNVSGYTTYSLINHIEYDEEAYHTILKTFNSIRDTYSAPIKSECNNIKSRIDSFPDKYSSEQITTISNNIDEHIGLIDTLSETTNYSLLAYQTCDNGLENHLYSLVDSLFGDTDKKMGDQFKKVLY